MNILALQTLKRHTLSKSLHDGLAYARQRGANPIRQLGCLV